MSTEQTYRGWLIRVVPFPAIVSALGGSLSVWRLHDEELAEFRDRALDEPYPYVWFDATDEKVREDCRIVSQAAEVAVGARDTGEKTVLGLAWVQVRRRPSGWSSAGAWRGAG